MARQRTSPLERAAHGEEGVFGSRMVSLVEGYGVGQVQHVDLFELALGPVVGRHHVEREIADVHDPRVTLSDPTSLHHEDTAAGGSQDEKRVIHDGREFGARTAGRHAADEDVRAGDRVQPDAVSQERAASAPLRGIHRENADAADRSGTQIRALGPEPEQQLVKDRTLAGAARTRDAQHRRGRPDELRERRPVGGLQPFVLREADQAGRRAALAKRIVPGEIRDQFVEGCLGTGGTRLTGVPQHVVHHAFDADYPVVPRGIDPRDPVRLQGGGLMRPYYAATAPEYPDIASSGLPEQVHQVAEELVVSPLVGGHRDGVRVFLEGGGSNLSGAAVVTQMNDLGSPTLQEAAEDVDRSVVAIEQRGPGDEAERKLRQRIEGDPRRLSPGRGKSDSHAQPGCPRRHHATMALGNAASETVALIEPRREAPRGTASPFPSVRSSGATAFPETLLP